MCCKSVWVINTKVVYSLQARSKQNLSGKTKNILRQIGVAMKILKCTVSQVASGGFREYLC